MSPKTYSIRQAWHDVLLYEEGEGRVIELLLPMFPVGTALGAFGLWTLLRAGARDAFR